MPLHFQIPIPNTSDVVDGQFTDDEWATLRPFHAEWDRLRQAEWIANGMPAQFNIEWEDGVGQTLSTPDKPTNAQVKEVLHGLRPFVLNDEALFFPKALNIPMRALQHPWMREQKRIGLARFTGADVGSMYQLSANYLQLNTDRALNLWLNAFEYHRDPVKYATFIRERGKEPDELDLATFRSMLVGRVDAIQGLVGFITWFENNTTPS